MPAIRTREDAEAFIDARIGHGVKPGLERIEGLLEFMGNPEREYATVHVAGTNGKTTVTRAVQQILGAHGLSVGGFTSPHLERVEERFTIHGKAISGEAFTQAVSDIAWFVVGYESEAGTSVTYFEVTAALAFALFASAAVDAAVIEVGLGGRLDATNVIDGDVSVVTGIDIDHVEFLGPTIAGIAGEKVAILKEGGTLVTGKLPREAMAPVMERVEAMSARWVHAGREYAVTDATIGVGGWLCDIDGVYGTYPDLFLPVHGRHQVDNLATSIASAELFLGKELDHELLALAVASMRTPGRLEVVRHRPLVILDGCHNVQGFEGLAETLDFEFPKIAWDVVIGVRGERNVEQLVAPLSGLVGHVHACAADDPVSRDPDGVASEASRALGVESTVHGSVAEAVDHAIEAAGPEGGVVVAGSLYVVGEIRPVFGIDDAAAAEAHLRFEAKRPEDEDEDGFEDEEGSSYG